jgi:hypothetical protein
MWFRFFVAGAFSLLGLLAILWGAGRDPASPAGAVWLNVGTEVIGIAITVAIVDALFELRRRQGEMQALARRTLGELDYVVWVWQGGRRDSSVFELRDLLRLIGPEDRFADCTAELIFSLGCEAQTMLSWQEEVVRSNKDLAQGLEALKPLTAMRDPDNALTIRIIQDRLQSAATHLARAAGLHTMWHARKPVVALRDPSVEAQIRRHFGQAIPEEYQRADGWGGLPRSDRAAYVAPLSEHRTIAEG